MIRNKAALKIEYSKGAKKYNPDEEYNSDSPSEEDIVFIFFFIFYMSLDEILLIVLKRAERGTLEKENECR